MSPSENVVENIMRSQNFCYFLNFCGTKKTISGTKKTISGTLEKKGGK